MAHARFPALSLLLPILLLAGSTSAVANPAVTWTLMYYVAADYEDLEASLIKEVRWLKTAKFKDNVAHLVMLFDGSGGASPSGTNAVQAPKPEWNVWIELTPTAGPNLPAVTVTKFVGAYGIPSEPDTASVTTLQMLLAKGLAYAPQSDHFALVMIGHGNGTLGLCPNENGNQNVAQCLTVPDLHLALKGFRDGWDDTPGGTHHVRANHKNLEVLFLDACFMSHLEVLLPPIPSVSGSTVTEDVDQIVAGADFMETEQTCHASILESIDDATTDADALAPRFASRYLLPPAPSLPPLCQAPGDHTRLHDIVASFRPRLLLPARAHLEKLAEELIARLTAGEIVKVASARNESEGYDASSLNNQPDKTTYIHRDLWHFCSRILALWPRDPDPTKPNPLQDAADALIADITAARTEFAAAPLLYPAGHGLTVHFPTGGVYNHPDYGSTGGAKWRAFLNLYRTEVLKVNPPCPGPTSVPAAATISPENPSVPVQSVVSSDSLAVASGVYFAPGAPGDSPEYLGSLPVDMSLQTAVASRIPPAKPGGRAAIPGGVAEKSDVAISYAWNGTWPRLEVGENWIPCPVRLVRPLGGAGDGMLVEAPVLRRKDHGQGAPERLVLRVQYGQGDVDQPGIVGRVLFAYAEGPGGPTQVRLAPGDRITGVYQSGFNGSNADVDLTIPDFGYLEIGESGRLGASWGPLKDGRWSVLLFARDLLGRAYASAAALQGAEVRIARGGKAKHIPDAAVPAPAAPPPAAPSSEPEKPPKDEPPKHEPPKK